MKWYCLIICAISFVAGVYFGKHWFAPKINTTTDSTVMLEKIKDVFKLVFVEAHFSELYSQKDYNWFDISPFRKSAIIRIQANVTAGVDMDSSRIDINEKNKTIRLRFNQQPVILYMDHSLDYYDLQQGTFNSFSSSELTEIELKAKETIRKKAMESDLLQRASKKRDDMIRILNQMVQSLGWKLVIEDSYKNERMKN